MSINLNEAFTQIRSAGSNNVRIVPMPGQNVHTGSYKIEIQQGGSWKVVAEGMPRATADNIVKQATNRVICE